MTNFITNLCALLNIVDTSRIKIVGVHSGSTAVTSVITPSIGTSTNNTNSTNSTSTGPSLATISTNLNNHINSGYFANVSGSALGTTVLQVQSSYFPLGD